MKSKRFLRLIITIVLLLAICGCNKVQNNAGSSYVPDPIATEKKAVDYMTLLYSAADTFNPYTVKTNINRQLCMLLYEPLVEVNNEFEPVYALAKTVKTSGKRCVVTLKDTVFSDGSVVTADDVVYSCKLALKAGNSYSKKLYSVKSVSAADSETIEFILSKADPYFINLLDFPIIKAKSDTVIDSDSVVQPPVGCGKYKVSKNKKSLVINNKYSGKKGSIKKIKLINAPDSESVAHYAQIGAADMYYSDVSDGNILRISGKKLDINLNNLVYIGINKNYGQLMEKSLRQAISAGIDRSKICQDSYYNNAVAATGFFNPVWKVTSSVQNIQISSNPQIAVENLEKIGYNSLDSKGIRLNSSGQALEFTLLVNSENRFRVAAANSIASQLSEVGIKITVVEKNFKQYRAALKKGNFQLFLGEVKLTDNMDISCLVTEGGSAAFGLYKEKEEDSKNEKDDKTNEEKEEGKETEESEEKVEKDENDLSLLTPGDVVNGFYEGENTITDIASVLLDDMPFVPVCYRTGVLFCNENIENINSFSASDIYSSINSYIINQ